MRVLLVLLVLANLLVFAWWQGHLDDWLPGARDTARVARQVAPERLQVVPIERLDAALRASCFEVGPLDAARAERAAAWARELGPKVELQGPPPVLRIRFADTVPPQEQQAGLATLAEAVGAQPRPCPPAPPVVPGAAS